MSLSLYSQSGPVLLRLGNDFGKSFKEILTFLSLNETPRAEIPCLLHPFPPFPLLSSLSAPSPPLGRVPLGFTKAE